MSKIETQRVSVTKTTVRYTLKEYEDLMVKTAVADAGVDASHPELGTHVSLDGEDVVVELLIEETAAAPEEDLGPRPELV